jgi:2-polyprenyl-3-methyl-5-hydroxy-6-metoxy-1,4-benzoquinol methylase
MTKSQYIIKRCKNKTVLDLGCVSHNQADNQISKGVWLHEQICEVASKVIGVDIVEFIHPDYTIYKGDVEHLGDLSPIKGLKFDVIVAGDIIEHVFNAGLFLDSIRAFCTPETEIIITTPNMRSLRFSWDALFKEEESCRGDHTCWYSKKTLRQLMGMKNFQMIDCTYGSISKVNGMRPLIRKIGVWLFPHMGYALFTTFKLK